MRRVSDDRLRAATDDPHMTWLGVACYAGSVEDGMFEGSFVGNARDWDMANRFLQTADDSELLKIRSAHDSAHGGS
jgi:hypothetical protein